MPRRLQLREGLEILVRNFIPEDRSAGWLLADVQLIGLFLAVGYQLVAIASDEPHAAQRCKDTGAEHDATADVDVGKVIIDNTTALEVVRVGRSFEDVLRRGISGAWDAFWGSH